MRFHPAPLLATVLALALAATLASSQTTQKPRITTEDDLPRSTYPVHGDLQALFTAPPDTFAAFAQPVGAEVDRILRDFDIQDHTTLRTLLQAKINIALLSGNNAEALALIPRIRSLEDKPGARLIDDLPEESFLKARLAQGVTPANPCPAGFEALYRNATNALPWAKVRFEEKNDRGFYDLATPGVFAGFVESQLGPSVAKEHALSLKGAESLIAFRELQAVLVPCKQPVIAVMTDYIRKNDVAKPSIWEARNLVLAPSPQLTPVTVGIWDSGFDTALFPGRLFTDPTPGMNDPHGIAFDVLDHPTHGNLIPLTPQQQKDYPVLVTDMQAFSDVANGIDSDAGTALKHKLTTLSPQAMRGYLDEMGAVGGYAHGTHVTGIAAAGNPAIRLAYARMTYDEGNPHMAPTDELQHATATSYLQTVQWFQAHGVRVVNMSWWDYPANIEKDLEDNGIGKDPAERKQLARHYFQIESDGLYQALKSAPEILFVTIAGNSNQDNAFEEIIPSSFKLPNLIVAGAVDLAGDETNFTSYGGNVAVHANGYQVESVVPGGAKVRLSGTSMAAPQVTNLAAKLLAVSPSLTPTQLVALIRDPADPTPDGRRHLMNPKASMAHLQQQKAGQTSSMTTPH